MNMKHIAAMCLMALMAFTTSCSSDDEALPSKVEPTAQGTFTDERDGETYGWVRYGNLDWMTENYRYEYEDETYSTIYQPADDYYNYTNKSNLAKYGRLYTMTGAVAACPEGWRLPTDADWQELEKALGMSATDAASDGWRSNIAHNMYSTKSDPCSLNLLLGGLFNTYIGMGATKWRMMGVYGYYWTSTVDKTKEGDFYYVRKLSYNSNQVWRGSMEPAAFMLSVRYVRDAQ